ncbi:hypothetical protein EVAR_8072_1 [Eumeta japonica]|uniref:Uncharacterized protein n=1 Tax=Eumeta variegata TaxID=151549 RepID=A0A4C1TSM7_EUMVA|nr:hypothetical protein EVAR_8072_1 [Eumeta japonica]
MKAVRTEMQKYRNSISSIVVVVDVCNDRKVNLTKPMEAIKNMSARTKIGQGIPEEKTENCVHLTLIVATKLGVALEERDIDSAERRAQCACGD